jgi:hypothetical protein
VLLASPPHELERRRTNSPPHELAAAPRFARTLCVLLASPPHELERKADI